MSRDKCNEVYEPREDSFLLQGIVKRLAKGLVLDMGTGSGIQALTAAKKKSVKKVLAVDINPKAIAYCKKNCQHKKITCCVSDLFSKVRGKFDTIIFNPPYLPKDHKVKTVALEGGKKGYEIIMRFLKDVKKFLKPDGKALLVFSSLSHPGLILDEIEKQFLIAKKGAEQRVFFEDLFVYVLTRSPILNELERKGIKSIQYFARGKRGMVFTGKYCGVKVAIKVKRPSSEAIGRIANEARWLKVLNKHKIGPKFITASKLYLIYRFVTGEYLEGWLPKANGSKARKVLSLILHQAFLLDKLGINKEEMHRPLRNVVVKGASPVLIDFERTHKAKKPKNVTQFCHFLMGRRKLLKQKGIIINKDKLVKLARAYKQDLRAIKELKKVLYARRVS